MSTSEFPTPLEIKALAEDYGYVERRKETSNTLFFKENKAKQSNNHPNNNDSQPILINIFYTTRGIMTQLPHPTQGYNQLWRSSAYDSLETLALLFENPRTHTGKGYRQAKNAVRGCAKCGWQKARMEFTSNQWRAGPGKAVCSECISGKKGEGGNGDKGGQRNDGVEDISRAMGKVKLEDDSNGVSFPKLTLESLEQHNKENAGIQLGEPIQATNNGMERRQFNCPLCPMEGRGKNVFFKKVPVSKPIVKCNKCKAAKLGNCERLYPIPRGDEKGYGHYRCGKCKNTWGSSRAIAGIGQECQVCSLAGNPSQFIKPFRIEVYKSGNAGGITGGGSRPAGRRMRRVPRETISENEPVRTGYSNNDAQRFRNRGGNALAGTGSGGAGRSYDYVEDKNGGNTVSAAPRLPKSAYKHKCEGCSTGVCRSRKLPISGIHDVHDGNTVSTSASLLTNSEIDKSEFRDMDIDFEDWEDEDDGEQWVTVGPNGKVLKG